MQQLPRFYYVNSSVALRGIFLGGKTGGMSLKNIWKLWLTIALAVFMLAACGGTTEQDEPVIDDTPKQEGIDTSETAVEFPVTITDEVNNEITFDKAPETIVSLIPSNTEILYALGLGEKIVGVSDQDNYPAEVEEVERVGGQEFNVEAIVALNPDVVFAHAMNSGIGDEGLQQLRDAGITVFVVKNALDFNETYETITTIGQATGQIEEAEEIVANMKAKVEEVIEKTATAEQERTVLVETDDVPHIYAPGTGTFIQEMLDMIGAKNIVTDKDWVLIDPEAIVDGNPDVIIVMYDHVPDIIESVKKRDGFEIITAVKDDAVVQVDADTTSRTGPRLAEGFEEIAKAIYPEVFSE